MSGIAALTTTARVQVVNAVVNRHSLRSTVRLTGVPQNRIKALIMRLGPVCTQYQDEALQGLRSGELQWNATLAFRAKVGSTPEEQEYRRTTGSVWTWTCVDSQTKLVPSWRIGPKNSNAEVELRADISHRYDQLKPIGSTRVPTGWSPPDLRGREHLGHISPAWFVTLSTGFARKVERHAAALALYLMYYNFSLVHEELGMTSAMASGKASRIWRVGDIVNLLDRTIAHSVSAM